MFDTIARYCCFVNSVLSFTVRSESKAATVTSMLEHEGISTCNLSFAFADLTKEDGWEDAMTGIDKVIHVASPLGGNNHENPELIPIAENGVKNVLNAAIKAGISKVVMTSSQAACYPDKKCSNSRVNESFWTETDNKWITNYMRSKLYAEKAAWEIIGEQNHTQLTTILPGAILDFRALYGRKTRKHRHASERHTKSQCGLSGRRCPRSGRPAYPRHRKSSGKWRAFPCRVRRNDHAGNGVSSAPQAGS